MNYTQNIKMLRTFSGELNSEIEIVKKIFYHYHSHGDKKTYTIDSVNFC